MREACFEDRTCLGERTKLHQRRALHNVRLFQVASQLKRLRNVSQAAVEIASDEFGAGSMQEELGQPCALRSVSGLRVIFNRARRAAHGEDFDALRVESDRKHNVAAIKRCASALARYNDVVAELVRSGH